MPQLPPVAAAAFVLCLLTVIVGTVVVVQVQSRRRRTRLAEMVRATAPVPRPAVSLVEPPAAATLAPLRGKDYGAAEGEGRFQPFEERPARAPAPGRPARRLAAHVEGMSPTSAAAVTVVVAVAEPPLVVSPVGPVPGPVVDSVPPSAEEAVPVVVAESSAPAGGEVTPVARSEADVSQAREAATAPEPVSVTPALPVTPSGSGGVQVDELAEPALAAPPLSPPAHEPRITVLPPRPAVPALPALMTREIALGDAARALRGALPDVLTMTDGRRLRRAVAIGAATSVVAAAFAIRGRRR